MEKTDKPLEKLHPPPPPPPLQPTKITRPLLPLPPIIQRIQAKLEAIKIYRESLKGKGPLNLRKNLRPKTKDNLKKVRITFSTTPYHRNLYNVFARTYSNSLADFINFVLNDYITRARNESRYIIKKETQKTSKTAIEDFIIETQKERVLEPSRTPPSGKRVNKIQKKLKDSPMKEVIDELKEYFKNPQLEKVPDNWRELRDKKEKEVIIK
jgi:hypothetical protein